MQIESNPIEMMAASLDFTYRYTGPSAVTQNSLRLATSSPEGSHPYFFQGQALNPELLAQQLLGLTEVVRTHYFLPRPAILDPVLTSSSDFLRVEGFSGCCGVYVRVDLPTSLFDGECKGKGTTNVDFNDPMRRALLAIRGDSKVSLAVGEGEVALETSSGTTVEKKVKLPVRWVKSFSEVQRYQSELALSFDIKAHQGLEFLRSLSRNSDSKLLCHVTGTARGIRISRRAKPGAVPLAGPHRLQTLEPLLRTATGLRVWSNPECGVSGWEVYGRGGTYWLVLSPEVFRGFSGEGQNLGALAQGHDDLPLAEIRAQLHWQSAIDCSQLSQETGHSQDKVERSLAVLGSRGLAGFDRTKGRYFHRELPFDLERVEALQPRLKAARVLVEEGGVKQLKPGEYLVRGTEVFHHVRASGQEHCSCPWHSKYLGKRGPCKHILAAQLFDESN